MTSRAARKAARAAMDRPTFANFLSRVRWLTQFTNKQQLPRLPSRFRHPLTYGLEELTAAPDDLLKAVENSVEHLADFAVKTETLWHTLQEDLPGLDQEEPLTFATLGSFVDAMDDCFTEATGLKKCIADELVLVAALNKAQPAIDDVVDARRVYDASAKATEEQWTDYFGNHCTQRERMEAVNDMLFNPSSQTPILRP